MTREEARAALSWLQSMYDYLKDPDHWCQGARARDSKGYALGLLSDWDYACAARYSLLGSCDRERYILLKLGADRDKADQIAFTVLGLLLRAMKGFAEHLSLHAVSQTQDHAAVLDLLRRALSIAQASTEEVQ